MLLGDVDGEACPLVFELTLLFTLVLVFAFVVSLADPVVPLTLPVPVVLDDPVPVPEVVPVAFVLVFWFTFVLTFVLSVEPVDGLALPPLVVPLEVDGLALPCADVASCDVDVPCVPEPTLVDELWLVVLVWSPEPTLVLVLWFPEPIVVLGLTFVFGLALTPLSDVDVPDDRSLMVDV